jgi:hypothetical protein
MSENSESTASQAEAFQKIWAESLNKTTHALFSFGPNSAPPEVVRELRSGLFQALGKSWEEFMRSPQFLEGMKQWLDQAITWRKMANDFMANARSEQQATSRDDIDTVMLTVRHMERRVLDRMEELSAQVAALQGRMESGTAPKPASKPAPSRGPVQRGRRASPRIGKG